MAALPRGISLREVNPALRGPGSLRLRDSPDG